MKTREMIMLIALGLTASGALAQYSLTDQPYIPKDPALIDTGQLAAQIRTIQTTTQPLQALEAYSQALKTAPRNVALHEAYMDRMLQLNQLQMASIPARTLTQLKPDNGRAWGVMASVSASSGEMATALSAIARAATLDPNEAWIDRLAGQLMARYDAQARKPQLLEQDRALLAQLPKEVTSSDAFLEGYGDRQAFAPSSEQAAADAQATTATQPAETSQDQADLQQQIYGLQQQTGELSREVGDLNNQLYSTSPDYYASSGYGYNDLYANYNPPYQPDWWSGWGGGWGWGGWGWGWPLFVFDNDFDHHHHHGDFDHHWSDRGHNRDSNLANGPGNDRRRGSGSGAIAARTGRPAAGRPAVGKLPPDLGRIPLDRLGARSRGAGSGASALVNRNLSAGAAGSGLTARGGATTVVPRVNPRAGVAVRESRSLPFASGRAAPSVVSPTPRGAAARPEVTIVPRSAAGNPSRVVLPSATRVPRGQPGGRIARGPAGDSSVMSFTPSAAPSGGRITVGSPRVLSSPSVATPSAGLRGRSSMATTPLAFAAPKTAGSGRIAGPALSGGRFSGSSGRVSGPALGAGRVSGPASSGGRMGGGGGIGRGGGGGHR